MNRVVIVHGWGGSPGKGWFPWLKNELQQRGIPAYVPRMPSPNTPHCDAWVATIAQTIGVPKPNWYLVGHSLGVMAILRYLESLHEGQSVGGVLSLAGFSEDLGIKEHATFFTSPLNYENVHRHTHQLVALQSDNDPYVDVKYSDILRDNAGAHVVLCRNMKHFSGDDGFKEMPVALDALVEMIPLA